MKVLGYFDSQSLSRQRVATMNAKKILFNHYLPQIGSLIILFILFFLYGINQFYPIGFYFDASWAWYKQVFPNLYFVGFLFFRLLVPAYLACWFLIILKEVKLIRMRAWIPFFCALIFLGAVCLFHFWGFDKAIVIVLISYMLFNLFWFCSISIMQSLISAGVFARRIIRPYFFFIIYIFGCLMVNRNFCPFYRFDMFDKMDENGTSVIILRDCKDSLIPYNNFSTLREGDMFNIYARQHEADSTVGRKLIERLLISKITNNFLECDSISVSKLDIFIKNDKIKLHEQRLYKSAI